MGVDEAIKAINAADNADEAAEIAFRAIVQFDDLQMGDGDGAREVAEAWITRWVKS